MAEKRNNKRMKIIPFTQSNVYGTIINDTSPDTNRIKPIDKPAFKVFERKKGTVLGTLVDISINGIMIVSKIPITEKKVQQLRMEFMQIIEFDARCVWFRDVGDDYFICGFEFNKIEPEDIDTIKKTITQFLKEY